MSYFLLLHLLSYYLCLLDLLQLKVAQNLQNKSNKSSQKIMGIRKNGKRYYNNVYRFFIEILFVPNFMKVAETLLKQLLYYLLHSNMYY